MRRFWGHAPPYDLQLPENWTDYSAGALVGYILDQVDGHADRVTAGRMLTGAALDLTASTRWRQLRPEKHLRDLPNGVWSIGKALYAFVPGVDSETINACLAMVLWSINTQIVTLPEEDRGLRDALDECIGRLRPALFGLPDFMNMHVNDAVVDARLSYREAVARVLESFNQRAQALDEAEAWRIALPWK